MAFSAVKQAHRQIKSFLPGGVIQIVLGPVLLYCNFFVKAVIYGYRAA